METTSSLAPRAITDEVSAICSKCKQVMYKELIVGTLNESGTYDYQRIVTGGFKQACDETGKPTGPVIPYCNCGEKSCPR